MTAARQVPHCPQEGLPQYQWRHSVEEQISPVLARIRLPHKADRVDGPGGVDKDHPVAEEATHLAMKRCVHNVPASRVSQVGCLMSRRDTQS
jgi:hypothetical protein